MCVCRTDDLCVYTGDSRPSDCMLIGVAGVAVVLNVATVNCNFRWLMVPQHQSDQSAVKDLCWSQSMNRSIQRSVSDSGCCYGP